MLAEVTKIRDILFTKDVIRHAKIEEEPRNMREQYYLSIELLI